MFLSGPYNNILTEDTTNDSSTSFRFKKKAEDNDINSMLESKSLFYSEHNLLRINNKDKQFSRSLTSLNYDADIEYDSEPEMVVLPEWAWELRCDLCGLEYGSPFDSTFACKENIQDSPKRERKNKRKLFHKRNKTERPKQFNPIVGGVNFEEFKDASYKMDKFDPTSERVWTLQYKYDQEIASTIQPKLSKIIIGRGSRNEYPELNSIHLISAMKNSQTSEWRNSIYENLKSNKNNISDKFNLLATNQTCLFCLYERNPQVHTAICNNQKLCSVKKEVHSKQISSSNGVEEALTKTDGGNEYMMNNDEFTRSTEVKKSKFNLLSKLIKPKLKNSFEEDLVDDEDFEII